MARWAAAALAALPSVGAVTVTSPAGQWGGSTEGGVDRFLGIRYGAAPVGPRRFLPSTAEADHPGPYDATKYGHACWQPTTASPPSEDCLFLNVWRPGGAAADAALPVMFWIHGGGMTAGSGGEEGAPNTYDGAMLAKEQNVVVVTINYRLGPLGFLASAELRAASGGANGGSNGIRDQVLALKWVKRNIAAFGGDTSRVMAFGESAGSHSVGVLSITPLAAGLFQRAAMESGAPIGAVWCFGTEAEGIAAGKLLMQRHNATSVEDLRSVDPASLVWTPATAGVADGAARTMTSWHDGLVLPHDGYIKEQWAAGKLNPQDVILGSNSKDGVLPYEIEAPVHMPNATNASDVYAADMDTYWSTYYAGPAGGVGPTHDLGNRTARAVRKMYPLADFGGNAISAFVQADGDFNVVCPTRRLALAAAAAGRGVYLYLYQHLWGGDMVLDAAHGGWSVPPTWASHGLEIPFVFGNFGAAGGTAGDAALSKAMRAYWGSFARTGAPAAAGAPAWRPLRGSSPDRALALGSPIGATTDGYRARLCAFWDRYF